MTYKEGAPTLSFLQCELCQKLIRRILKMAVRHHDDDIAILRVVGDEVDQLWYSVASLGVLAFSDDRSSDRCGIKALVLGDFFAATGAR